MCLMALDLGEKRIGVAISESKIIATPHTVIHRTSPRQDFFKIEALVQQFNVKQVIVGLPYSLTGELDERLGPQAQWVMALTEQMKEVVTAPITFFDESYSTRDAQTFMTSMNYKNIPIDAMAAAVILQHYLDAVSK